MPDASASPPGCRHGSHHPADPAAAAAFYGPLFGWEFEERMPPGSDGSYLMATLDGREVAAVSSAAPGSPVAAWNTYVQVDSADEVAVTVRAAGGTVITEPFDVFDAGRMAVCADPAGATFSLWRPGTTQGAEIVNAPGSWNFSELYADDLDAAQRVYGAVFGWEADAMDMGAWPADGAPAGIRRLPRAVRPRHKTAPRRLRCSAGSPTASPGSCHSTKVRDTGT